VIKTLRYLYCDSQECKGDEPHTVAPHAGTTATELRNDAAKRGWKRIGGKDYCPECADRLHAEQPKGGEQSREAKLQAVREAVVLALDQVHRENFAPEMQLTFVARHPTNKDCYVVISDDDELADFLTDHLEPKEAA
jgi:hypothetical protein